MLSARLGWVALASSMPGCSVMEGSTENAVVVKALQESLAERGISPGARRLFVIDGSKALRAGIDAVYGDGNPVQRCGIHKARNAAGYPPTEMGK